VTIHQPRSDLFAHFGNIMLLARGGNPVFAGPADTMLAHFAKAGYECPRYVNPADFALDLITVDLQHEAREEASRAKVRKLIDSWNPDLLPTTRTGSIATPAELGSLAREPASFTAAYSILIRRATKNFFRMPDLIIARVMQVVGLGLVLALFFAPLKTDYFAIQNRLGFLVEIAPLYFVGSKFLYLSAYQRGFLTMLQCSTTSLPIQWKEMFSIATTTTACTGWKLSSSHTYLLRPPSKSSVA
jgi:hypothetical protein